MHLGFWWRSDARVATQVADDFNEAHPSSSYIRADAINARAQGCGHAIVRDRQLTTAARGSMGSLCGN